MYQVTNYINGKECSESNESIAIINPSYGTDIGEVLYATKDSANNAIDAAAKQFKTWSKTGLSYRAELILKLRQGIINRSDEIINICVSEAGKTRPDAEAELDRAIQALTHTAGVQHFYPSIMSPNVAGGIDITDVRYPIGSRCRLWDHLIFQY
jgi:malonate-semialdehyde dehydrogenase (acetylating)/methylmalonate-semialdehyde dehydrogenase